MRKIAVLLLNFGPYHLARLEKLGALGKTRGLEVWGIEICSLKSHEWQVNRQGVNFTWKTLFPDQAYHLIPKLAQFRCSFRFLKRLRPDVVVTAGYVEPAMWGALALAKLKGRPAVVMGDIRGHDSWGPWLRLIKKSLVAQFDAALVAGTPQRHYFNSLGMPPARVFTGYDVIDNDYFSQRADLSRRQRQYYREALDLPDHYFLSVSRFIHEKNLPRLLKAYARYRELSPTDPWALVLCGSGALEDELRRKSVPGVKFCGFQQIETLPHYYGLAGCFILASIHESWGLVVNEAMASGLPVLVSQACGCTVDLVQEGINGFTFDPYEVEDLARLMLKMASGELDLQAMGEASRRLISHWTLETFAENLLKAVAVAQNYS
jgi:1,2-diacylglycerol 3-alpha-glucosyltransferase